MCIDVFLILTYKSIVIGQYWKFSLMPVDKNWICFYYVEPEHVKVCQVQNWWAEPIYVWVCTFVLLRLKFVWNRECLVIWFFSNVFFSKWVRSNTKLVLQKFLIKTIIELVVAKKSILKGKCQIKSSCLWHNLIANPSTFFILPEKLQLVHWNCLEVDSLTREVIILSIILIYQQSVPVLPAYTQHTLIRFLIKMWQKIVNNSVRPWWRNY